MHLSPWVQLATPSSPNTTANSYFHWVGWRVFAFPEMGLQKPSTH